jgi:hypothetical protein
MLSEAVSGRDGLIGGDGLVHMGWRQGGRLALVSAASLAIGGKNPDMVLEHLDNNKLRMVIANYIGWYRAGEASLWL